MSPEVIDNELPDQVWLVDEIGGESSSATVCDGSTVNSSASLLKLEESRSGKEAMKENIYHPQCHTLIQQNYLDMKIMKDKRRSRKAKCCLVLAILVIFTLCVITLVAATQIFYGNEYEGTKLDKNRITSNNSSEVDTTTTYRATSELLMHYLNSDKSNTSTTLTKN